MNRLIGFNEPTHRGTTFRIVIRRPKAGAQMWVMRSSVCRKRWGDIIPLVKFIAITIYIYIQYIYNFNFNVVSLVYFL